MSWKCPHCGFDTELAPLVIKDREGVASCPRCDRALSAGPAEVPDAQSLRWIERESPALFDHLMEKMDRRTARRRIVRRFGVLVGVVLLALLVYLMVS